ncbi:transmembrane protein 271-like [Synchiropus splendidus]|uniref:transmembrane protein 271-like n=1 Tax=Synchiropus splendidus TaxID=270530 RepID=UPI00237DA98D|nr:transmembrane protein 271-like [Synchiropus splendidus]
MMKLSGKGLCTVFSSTILFVCALGEVVVGLRCVSLGSAVKERFHLGAAAGAFYSGILVGLGQVLLGTAMLCCTNRAGCRNFFLLGVVVFLLGVLTAFSGAVVDGDTAALVERKYSHYCYQSMLVTPACERLRGYQRGLVLSTVLSTLECVLGLIHLLIIKRYKAAQLARSRRAERESARAILFREERDSSCADLQPVSYINLAVFSVFDEGAAEVRSAGHPSVELPGYASSDPELNHCFPFSYPLPSELPPAYEDIFPAASAAHSRS